jgi:hypothetical protein
VMRDVEANALALWSVHTHGIAAAEHTPYIHITSAEMRCGKTRLLECLELLVARPWLTGRVTAAVLARKVDAEQPTLLLDELDAQFNADKENSETLRGILNTGHRLGGKTSVCVGQGANISYRDFSTYCAKCIAGIGDIPETLSDRSIRIELKRARPDEPRDRFRRKTALPLAEPLRIEAEAWALQNIDALIAAEPDLPDALSDRAQDSWEPLFAIADAAGGRWPTLARAAAVQLHARSEIEQGSDRVRLLAKVRDAFDEQRCDRIQTTHLLRLLARDDTGPWADWWDQSGQLPGPTRGAARRLAEHLRPYGIQPQTIRLPDGGSVKGYMLDSFRDAFSRFLPNPPPSVTSVTSVTPSQPALPAAALPASEGNAPRLDADSDVTDVTDVTDSTERDCTAATAEGDAKHEDDPQNHPNPSASTEP